MFTPAEIAQEVAAIAGIFEAALPEIGQITNNQAIFAEISAAIDDLKAAAQAFADADAQSVPSLILRIENDGNAVLAQLAQLPLPPDLATAMRIAQILLPTVVAVAGMLWLG